MRAFSLLALAVGLAMDATAVSAAQSLSIKGFRPVDGTKMALSFGLFQALMPALGCALGVRYASAIDAWKHWIAFVLLAGIGAKMLYEVYKQRQGGEESKERARLDLRTLFLLSVATSIDALIAGVTLPTLEIPITVAAATIGVVTAALSGLGAYLGKRAGASLGGRLEFLGGVLLIGLGAKVLLEHFLSGAPSIVR